MDIKIEIFCEIIGNRLIKEWGNNNNKLTLSCLYALNIFSEQDLVYWKTVYILDYLIKKAIKNKLFSSIIHEVDNNCIITLMAAIYCILASNQTIYSLPSMLDHRWRNGKITPHILFGESLSNLLSITLIAESHKLLLLLDTKLNKNKLINLLNNQVKDFRHKSEVIKNFIEITKNMLVNDYNEFQKILLINTINSIFFLYGVDVPKINSNNDKIYQVAEEILNMTNIDNNDIISIINKKGLIRIIVS